MNWSAFPPRCWNYKRMVVNKHLEISSVQSKATAAQRGIKGILACMKNSAINESEIRDRNSRAVGSAELAVTKLI